MNGHVTAIWNPTGSFGEHAIAGRQEHSKAFTAGARNGGRLD